LEFGLCLSAFLQRERRLAHRVCALRSAPLSAAAAGMTSRPPSPAPE
jgi:hypothetical protein